MLHPQSIFARRTFAPANGEGVERPIVYPRQISDADCAFLDCVFDSSPYLLRLARSREDLLERLVHQPIEAILAELSEALFDLALSCPSPAELESTMRQLKGDAHLSLALAELSGALDVMDAARSLSEFADTCVRAGLAGLVRLGHAEGKFEAIDDIDNPMPGVFILALGKLGADELNFSSDIDLVAFYDPDLLTGPVADNPGKKLPRLIKALTRLLNENTSEGYVFRVDLRLRPDPSATPPILSINAAMNYYESLGQNWERAAYIKARPCAGDETSAREFLHALRPFIWRRTLDYAAVEDIHSLARQIQAVGDRAKLRPAGHDLKLGKGGIREIEFYAQIPQLVMGGRLRELRVTSPYRALEQLEIAGVVERDTVETLRRNYRFLRQIEHRIQMINDEQTQTLPLDDDMRARVARLAGCQTLDVLDDCVETTLRSVHRHFTEQFSQGDSLADDLGSLVFTGVEPTLETLETLEALGFKFPETAWARMNAWLAGKARAVRTTRARQVLTRVAPRLLRAMSATGEPDSAFTRFASFIEGLPSGVQPLSMLENEPALARELVVIIGLAPRMATTLAQRPTVIDVMLDARFSRPLKDDGVDDLADRMDFQMQEAVNAEDAMDRGRRLVREERFRIGAQLLLGRATAADAGKAFGHVADVAIQAMATTALQQMEARHGPPPGEFAILGLGKLGSYELAADSDLDLMVIYNPEAEVSDAAPAYFARLTQRLVSALSSPTAEGTMYETDMQLRPSGRAGPVAVRLSSFGEYYRDGAWTWERMALTRARIIVGSSTLGRMIEHDIAAALSQPMEAERIIEDVLDMRRRLERERRAKGAWDVKLRPGGILDIEFIAQAGQLLLAQKRPYQHQANTVAQIFMLAEFGLIRAEEAAQLTDTMELWLGLSQIIRTAHGSGFDAGAASNAFAQRLSELAGSRDLDALAAKIETQADHVRQIFESCLGQLQPDATVSPPRFVEWGARSQSGD